jgi:uncharacterized cupin superfamily protein
MPKRPDVFTTEAICDPADPPGFRGAEALVDGDQLGRAAGGRELNVRVFELPAGESLCPYHYEYAEEWLLLLVGELELRTPRGTETVAAGALVCFSAGPEGAHRVTTPAGAGRPARFVMFSSAHEPVVAVYPDGDKIGVWVPGGADNLLVRRADGAAGYYEGETGG